MKNTKFTVFTILTVSTVILSLSIVYNQATSKKNFTFAEPKRSTQNMSSSNSFFQEEILMDTIKDGKRLGTGKAKITRRKIDPSFSTNENSNDSKFIINN